MLFPDYLKKEGFKERSILNHSRNLSLFFNWLSLKNLKDVKTADILDYIQYARARGNGDKTIQIKKQNLKCYYDYLVEEELISFNPVNPIKLRVEKRRILGDYLKEKELDTLYYNYKSASDKNSLALLSYKRNKVILGLMVYQGLSVKDIDGLRLPHLDLEKGKLHLSAHSQAKGRSLELKAFQILPLSTYLSSVREDILNCRKGFLNELPEAVSDKVFFPLRRGSYFKDIRQHLTLELKKQFPFFKSFQQIRRSVIINWLKTYNLREVQVMAGHGSVMATERFMISQIDDLCDAVDKYHPLK